MLIPVPIPVILKATETSLKIPGWWRCVARFPKPLLLLFMTKACDFPYPIYDLTKNSIPYLLPDPC